MKLLPAFPRRPWRLLAAAAALTAVTVLGGCASNEVEVSTDGGPEGDGQFDSIATDNTSTNNTAPSASEPRPPTLTSGDWDFGR